MLPLEKLPNNSLVKLEVELNNECNLLHLLPNDIIRKIFSELNVFELPHLQSVDRRWNEIIASLYPYISYRIIRGIAKRQIGRFLKQASWELIHSRVGTKNASTNCFYNLMAVAIVVSGAKQVKNISDYLYCNYKFYMKSVIEVKKERLIIDVTVDNLLSGSLLVNINNKTIKCKNDIALLSPKLEPLFNHFVAYLNPILKKCAYEASDDMEKCKRKTLKNFNAALNNMTYNFNEFTFKTLQDDIKNNKSKTNQNKSFIYYVAITTPNLHNKKNGLDYAYYHCFTIEQYFSSIKKKCLYRLYQSNIHQMTLKNYFSKMKYDLFSDRGCLNQKQLTHFFLDVQLIVQGVKGPIDALSKRCFGSVVPQLPSSFYDAAKQSIHGLSLRYKSEEFSPKDCIKNFMSFYADHKSELPFLDLTTF